MGSVEDAESFARLGALDHGTGLRVVQGALSNFWLADHRNLVARFDLHGEGERVIFLRRSSHLLVIWVEISWERKLVRSTLY